MNWSAYTTHRDPVLRMYRRVRGHQQPERSATITCTATSPSIRATGRLLPHDQLKIGSEFFYPLHYSLHLEWKELGYWIVGLAALVMLAALVSGVVMHRKIFREFFTFRPAQAHAAQRARPAQPDRRGGAAVPLHVRAVAG